jgi:hypothetical protein
MLVQEERFTTKNTKLHEEKILLRAFSVIFVCFVVKILPLIGIVWIPAFAGMTINTMS